MGTNHTFTTTTPGLFSAVAGYAIVSYGNTRDIRFPASLKGMKRPDLQTKK